MMGISFIVPVYNGEKTIQACIKSILAQELTCNKEVIVVDNGSTDSTLERIQEYSEIKVIKEPNKGRSKARNSGARSAKYPFLAFIDCDVVLLPLWANQLLKALKMPFGAVQTPLVVNSKKRNEEHYYLNHISLFQTIDSAAMMISREVFNEIGTFSEKLSYWEDSELSIRLMNYGYGLMVVDPSLAMKFQNRRTWELCIRAFMIGRNSASAIKTWTGRNPVRAKDLLTFRDREISLVNFFQVLGSVFPSTSIDPRFTRKRGWRQMSEGPLISRQLLTFVTPDFISLRTISSKLNFTIKKEHPQFDRLLKMAFAGEPILEELIEMSHSSSFNALILRRYLT